MSASTPDRGQGPPDRLVEANWIEKVGGYTGGARSLHKRLAKHLMEDGKTKSQAYAIAVSQIRKACATGILGGRVKIGAEARARFCAAAKDFEAMRAKNKLRESQDIVIPEPTAAEVASVSWESIAEALEHDRLVEARQFNELDHPRGRKGSRLGGKFIEKALNSKLGPYFGEGTMGPVLAGYERHRVNGSAIQAGDHVWLNEFRADDDLPTGMRRWEVSSARLDGGAVQIIANAGDGREQKTLGAAEAYDIERRKGRA